MVLQQIFKSFQSPFSTVIGLFYTFEFVSVEKWSFK